MRLLQRWHAAVAAFREVPDERWLVVERVGDLGWAIIWEGERYEDAAAFRDEQMAIGRPHEVRTMTLARWRRDTLAHMASEAPWHAIGRITAEMNRLRSDVDLTRRARLVGLAERDPADWHPHPGDVGTRTERALRRAEHLSPALDDFQERWAPSGRAASATARTLRVRMALGVPPEHWTETVVPLRDADGHD